jgi:ADP-ribose pyrophosphatase YjhB (NUDIX family)
MKELIKMEKVAIAIVINKGKYIFQIRKKEPYRNFLGLLGGKLLQKETMDEAIEREIYEESNLQCEKLKQISVVTEHISELNDKRRVDLFVYEVKAKGLMKNNLREGDLVALTKSQILKNKQKFIPTDFEIIKKYFNQNLHHHEFFVEKKEDQFYISEKESAGLNGLIIGSFRKHYAQISEIIELFNKNNIQILSPQIAQVVNPSDEFVLFDYDPEHLNARELEDIVLKKCHKADFVYLVNPQGYVGLSASFEIGYCYAHNLPIFAMEFSDELCMKYIKYILSPNKVAEILRK